MVTPRTSLGSISLVNWSRWNVQETERASAWARVVLPTPGTSSMSKWPRASRHTSDRLTASGFPRRAELSMVSSSASLAVGCVKAGGGASIVSRRGITVILLNSLTLTPSRSFRRTLPHRHRLSHANRSHAESASAGHSVLREYRARHYGVAGRAVQLGDHHLGRFH